MALAVVGAGFGRTGTLSLKSALETLGVGRCHHMFEVMADMSQAPRWTAAARGEPVHWDGLLGEFGATVDWPGCAFWRELAEAYPQAKVVLSVRPPERWYDSFHHTIRELLVRGLPAVADLPEGSELAGMIEMAKEVIVGRSFGGDLGERDHALAAYHRHNDAVRAGVEPARLLVYDVAEGWEPLCAFLGRPVPDEPFPNVNDREFFRSLFLGHQDEGADA